MIRPLCRSKRSDSLCRIGTRFHFTTDKGRVHKVTSLPHFREDTYVDRIDPKPIDSIELNQLISSCAALQSSSAQELLDTLADNRKDATHTPYVLEGADLPSSIITKVESDVAIYLKDDARHLRAQFHAGGHKFNLPVTSVGLTERFFMNSSHRKKKLNLKQTNINFVCMSLARPFRPWLSSYDDVARCYATLTGAVICNDNKLIVM